MKKLLTDFYLRKLPYEFCILPSLCVWYRKDMFLETGVYTPAYGIKLTFLRWTAGVHLQWGY